MSLLKRKDLIFLFVPGIIGGIVILSIWLLDIQLLVLARKSRIALLKKAHSRQLLII